MSFWNRLSYVVKVNSVTRMKDTNLDRITFRRWLITHTVIAISGEFIPGDLAVFIKNGVKVPDGFTFENRILLAKYEEAFSKAKGNGDAQSLIYTYGLITHIMTQSEYTCFNSLRRFNYIVRKIKSRKDPDVNSEGILIPMRQLPRIQPKRGLDCTEALSLVNGDSNG